ncbi:MULTISPECIES: hypothetical protein [unclassified Flavobacterium]|uniref:hypothetical protein n=1 Tax=unclassified Flavobacterium TaxID=196869 RepID=UPI000964E7C5|nr:MULTISPECIES: hypothetical protein [unclassified Flavobacterium]MBN9283184.1 hypothetical protein [Flavobacterium sp.]OJV67810.1 MAG: hypothetical protein BGO42_17460 [Flavobacterium sp. 40-81]
MARSKPIGLRQVAQPEDLSKIIVSFPKPADVLAEPEHFEQQILLPQYSIPGHFIKPEFTGLVFHFIVTPVFLDYADFRLTADNKYEIVSYSETPISDFDEKFLKWCADEMEDNFYGYKEEPIYFEVDKSVKSESIYMGGEPIWDQTTYEKDNVRKTDYSLDIFKDENGEVMEYIATLYDDEVYGSYNLYYSPKTRLLRQFHQST